MMKRTLAFLTLALIALAPQTKSFAASAGEPLRKVDWSFEGFTGTYDRSELQRGYQIYKEVCSSCHGLKYVAYRNLAEIGFSEDEVKALAAQMTVMDGPDDFGDMFERPGVPSDYITGPFANDNAARAANGGALPPDLSLMAKARADGSNYIFSLLTGYEDGHEVAPGMSYNRYFPGNQIAMGQPLYDDQVVYADGTPATLDQMSKDVTVFLTWAAEPRLEHRHSAGYKVIFILLVLTILLYFSNKKVWANIKNKD